MDYRLTVLEAKPCLADSGLALFVGFQSTEVPHGRRRGLYVQFDDGCTPAEFIAVMRKFLDGLEHDRELFQTNNEQTLRP